MFLWYTLIKLLRGQRTEDGWASFMGLCAGMYAFGIVYVVVFTGVCVYVKTCMCEGQRVGESERGRVCVCVCVRAFVGDRGIFTYIHIHTYIPITRLSCFAPQQYLVSYLGACGWRGKML